MKTITREEVQLKAKYSQYAIVMQSTDTGESTVVAMYHSSECASSWCSRLNRAARNRGMGIKFEVEEIVD